MTDQQTVKDVTLFQINIAGDFNGWDKEQYALVNVDGKGLWELIIPPDENGKCRIHVGSGYISDYLLFRL